jgi:hypothetical protein
MGGSNPSYNDDTRLKGDTDGTLIGNVGDRLKVTNSNSSGSTGVQALNKDLRYEQMDASNGGVARGTGIAGTWTDIYSVTGSGILMGFRAGLSSIAEWYVRLVIDTEEIFFDTTGISMADVTAGAVWDFPDKGQWNLGFRRTGDQILWHAPHHIGMQYDSSIVIKARKDGGTKNFIAGFVARSID